MNKETKNERFTRLAISRVNKTTKQLELIGNLGNLNIYESTEDERRKVEEYLREKLEIAIERLNSNYVINSGWRLEEDGEADLLPKKEEE
tara:strand:+ start:571 stop:840 length:270 start_codon:yes stop_codon:yes gene_type:complete